jgi:hypothetical protein
MARKGKKGKRGKAKPNPLQAAVPPSHQRDLLEDDSNQQSKDASEDNDAEFHAFIADKLKCVFLRESCQHGFVIF